MASRTKALFVGFFAFGITNLILVMTLYRPVQGLPPPAVAPFHPLVGFTVYIGLAVWLFDWTARRIGNAWDAALALGGAQFLLVNVDMVLRGDRNYWTAAISTLVMVVTWTTLAAAWHWATRRE